MKKLLLLSILLCFITVTTNAQRYSSYKKPKTTTKAIQEDVNDSAYIYHNLGWDAFKAKDIGAARFYWERGANCNTNIPSRYNCAYKIAEMYESGEGVDLDNNTAFYYYNIGFANGQKVGNSEATKKVASFYEIGKSVQVDNYKALEWYNKAKLQGNKFCDADIKRLKEKIKLYGIGGND